MAFITISHKRGECIGCGLCIETAPAYWFMNPNGEAELQTILRTHKAFDYGQGLAQDERELRAAEEGCPVDIIRIG